MLYFIVCDARAIGKQSGKYDEAKVSCPVPRRISYGNIAYLSDKFIASKVDLDF